MAEHDSVTNSHSFSLETTAPVPSSSDCQVRRKICRATIRANKSSHLELPPTLRSAESQRLRNFRAFYSLGSNSALRMSC